MRRKSDFWGAFGLDDVATESQWRQDPEWLKTREQLMKVTRRELGVLKATGHPSPAHAAFMELHIEGVLVTLSVMAMRPARLDFACGGGAVAPSTSTKDPVADAAMYFFAGANASAAMARPVTETPPPADGEVFVYLLTQKGVLRITMDHEAVSSGTHPLTRLFAAGLNAMDAFRAQAEANPRGALLN